LAAGIVAQPVAKCQVLCKSKGDVGVVDDLGPIVHGVEEKEHAKDREESGLGGDDRVPQP
jgi:hypothetical protein